MTFLETLAALALVALVSYLAGRLGRASVGRGVASGGLNAFALADVSDVSDRQGAGVAAVAPLLPAEAAGRLAGSRRRESRVARHHYEALASEVARERRLAEYEALANEAGRIRRLAEHGARVGDPSDARGRVVPLHARPSTGLHGSAGLHRSTQR